MKKILLIIFFSCSYLLSAQEADLPTTYYLIRHAEKDRSDPNERDPSLTEKGMNRVKEWVKLFESTPFDAVYSTNFQRTRQTADAIAATRQLTTTLYNPRSFNMKAFKAATKGKRVLVVGHSNTIPFLANTLLGEKRFDIIDDDINGNLYVVTTVNNRSSASLLHFE